MHQNAFGGQALPGPAGKLIALPRIPAGLRERNKKREEGTGRDGVEGKGRGGRRGGMLPPPPRNPQILPLSSFGDSTEVRQKHYASNQNIWFQLPSPVSTQNKTFCCFYETFWYTKPTNFYQINLVTVTKQLFAVYRLLACTTMCTCIDLVICLMIFALECL